VGPLLRRGLYDGERRQSPAAPGAERRDGVKFQLIGTWRFVDENFCEKERQNICKEKFFFCRSLIGRLFVLSANQLNSSKSCGVVAAALEQQTKGHRRGTTV